MMTEHTENLNKIKHFLISGTEEQRLTHWGYEISGRDSWEQTLPVFYPHSTRIHLFSIDIDDKTRQKNSPLFHCSLVY